MTFDELTQYFESQDYSVDQITDVVYTVKDCVSGDHCFIEKSEFYNIATLAHYFYELNCDVPDHLEDMVHIYTNWRDHVKNIGFVPREGGDA